MSEAGEKVKQGKKVAGDPKAVIKNVNVSLEVKKAYIIVW